MSPITHYLIYAHLATAVAAAFCALGRVYFGDFGCGFYCVCGLCFYLYI